MNDYATGLAEYLWQRALIDSEQIKKAIAAIKTYNESCEVPESPTTKMSKNIGTLREQSEKGLEAIEFVLTGAAAEQAARLAALAPDYEKLRQLADAIAAVAVPKFANATIQNNVNVIVRRCLIELRNVSDSRFANDTD